MTMWRLCATFGAMSSMRTVTVHFSVLVCVPLELTVDVPIHDGEPDVEGWSIKRVDMGHTNTVSVTEATEAIANDDDEVNAFEAAIREALDKVEDD